MAHVLCVLYDDPVDGYPKSYPRDDIPKIDHYPGGFTTPTPKGDRLHARRAPGQRERRAWPATVPRGGRPPADRHVGQGRPRFDFRARAANRRRCHQSALLAGVHDGRAVRQGAKPEARDHGRNRVRPHQPPGRDRARSDRRRGDLLQQHQRVRARRDAHPVARSQLHPQLQDGGRRRLEHRRLRGPRVRPGGHAGRDCRCWSNRLCGPAKAEAVRCRPALHRPLSGARARAGAGRHLAPERRVAGKRLPTWSRSTRRSIPRRSTCSTTS